MWPRAATILAVKKRKGFKYPLKSAEPAALKESAVELDAPQPLLINVRAAKDQLSSLLEQAAHGNEIIITSDGMPKAKLVQVRPARKPFRVDWDLLRSKPLKPGAKSADELVREERDGRP
jgi:prevent-host-death family protein